MTAKRWSVQEYVDGAWVTRKDNCSAYEAMQFYDCLDGITRLTKDGQPLRYLFNDDPDLFDAV